MILLALFYILLLFTPDKYWGWGGGSVLGRGMGGGIGRCGIGRFGNGRGGIERGGIGRGSIGRVGIGLFHQLIKQSLNFILKKNLS